MKKRPTNGTHLTLALKVELRHAPAGISAPDKVIASLSCVDLLRSGKRIASAYLGQIDVEKDWLLGVGNLNSARKQQPSEAQLISTTEAQQYVACDNMSLVICAPL